MALKEVTPKEMAETIIGQQIVGVEINYDDETITLQLSNNDLEFSGEDISMRCYELDAVRLN